MKNKIDLKEFRFINFPLVSIILISCVISWLIMFLLYSIDGENKMFFVFYAVAFIFIAILIIFIFACNAINSYIRIYEIQTKQDAENKIIDRTLSFIQRWNDPDNLRFRRVANELYQLFEKQPIDRQASFIIKHLEDNTKEREDITNLLNFLEEMSICVEEIIVKEELLIKFFKGIVISYCKVYLPYIQDRREKKAQPNLYKPLTNLCEKWSNM